MTEQKSGEERVPVYVHGSKKPEAVEGYKWVPEKNEWKKDQILGWRRVSATPHEDKEGFYPPEATKVKKTGQYEGLSVEDAEENEKKLKGKKFFIEESLPQGDRD